MFLTEHALAARRSLSDCLELCPRAYVGVMRMRYWGTPNLHRIVSPQTDLVIEGFPRCANSFAVRAFRMANDPGGQLRIATHMHSPAQAILGMRWKIPTLILIRHPDEAVVSFPALAVQLNKNGLAFASERFWAGQIAYWTHRYAQFYKRLDAIRDKIVIADFLETTSDFGAVIQRINHCFGRRFIPFEHSLNNAQTIFANSGPHLSPARERNKIKETFEELYYSSRNSAPRREAVRAYGQFLRDS